MANAVRSATPAFAITATISAASGAAWRPTTAERISSARPVSSSARVCRTTRKMLIIAVGTASHSTISLVIIAPSV